MVFDGKWSGRELRFKIQKALIDNGKEFTDRFCATRQRKPTGAHPFDKVCSQHGIDHRLIKPCHPQLNGMVERCNGRVSEVLDTTRLDSAQSLEQTITRYVRLYNHTIPQRALGQWRSGILGNFRYWVNRYIHR